MIDKRSAYFVGLILILLGITIIIIFATGAKVGCDCGKEGMICYNCQRTEWWILHRFRWPILEMKIGRVDVLIRFLIQRFVISINLLLAFVKIAHQKPSSLKPSTIVIMMVCPWKERMNAKKFVWRIKTEYIPYIIWYQINITNL